MNQKTIISVYEITAVAFTIDQETAMALHKLLGEMSDSDLKKYGLSDRQTELNRDLFGALDEALS